MPLLLNIEISVQGNNLTAASTILAVIDTGTTLVGGPAQSIAAIYANIPGAQQAGAGYEGYWQYRMSAFLPSVYLWYILMNHSPCTACDTEVDVAFKFGDGPSWPIDPADFQLATIGGGICIGALFELDLSGSSSPDWIIGDTFLVRTRCVDIEFKD